MLRPSPEILDDPDFRKTNKTITRQLVHVQVCLNVMEYKAEVYRNSRTGETCHARFPVGVADNVNYGSSVRAFLFLLNNDCCVSIGKYRDFLKNMTSGNLDISKGMISKLSQEFAENSEPRRKSAASELFLYPVIQTDCTNARVNGQSAYVFICAAPDGPALYYTLIHGHETRYDQILETALAEYADVPCRGYYGTSNSMNVLFLMRQEDGSLYDKVSVLFG